MKRPYELLNGISDKSKTNIRNAGIFVLGVLITIVITKLADAVAPNEPILVKEYIDTITIVHDFRIPKVPADDDSQRTELEMRIRNLELLNDYDTKIKERIRSIKQTTTGVPNLVTTSIDDSKYAGFIQETSSTHFDADCPTLGSNYVDIRLQFINDEFVSQVAYLRVDIYKRTSPPAESLLFVLNDYYEVKTSENLIRLTNDLPKGNYQIWVGFVLKIDLDKEYPRFFMKTCNAQKS